MMFSKRLKFDDMCKNKRLFEKVKDFFVYSIGLNVRDWWNSIKWYFSNLKRFQPLIKSWRSWDYKYQVDLFVFGLKQLADAIDQYGHEEDVSRKKKVAAIKSLIAEMERDYKDAVDYRNEDSHEKYYGRYYAELKKARNEHYEKIFRFIVGQDEDKLNQMVKAKYETLSEEEKEKFDYFSSYVELFDGSGIEGWWY